MKAAAHVVSPFAMVPVEVALDHRLSKTHLRVLISLLSFRSRNTDTVFPSRRELAVRTGLAETKISTATGELEALGWLQKDGKGGFSRATRYRVTVPDCLPSVEAKTVTDSVTVDGSKTVTDSVTVDATATVTDLVTVTDSVTVTEVVTRGVTEVVTRMPVTEVVTRKEETKEHTNGTDKGQRTKKPASVAKPQDVDQQTWDDWLAMRKQQHAAVTQTALDRLATEAGKAGMSLAEVLAICCANGWRGFSAAWMRGRDGAKHAGHCASAAAPKSFAQQEREAGWARWEQMTGREHPDRIAADQVRRTVIDAPVRIVNHPLEVLP